MDDPVAGLQESLSTIQFYAPDTYCIVAVAGAFLLLFVSAFVSGSEIAFFSLSPEDVEEVEEERHPSDSRIKQWLERSERLLATILITNNLVNVAIVMFLGYAASRMVDFGEAVWLEFAILTVLLTFLLLLFGEIMPKVWCAQHALSFVRGGSGILSVLENLFYPLSSLLMRSKVFTDRLSRHSVDALTVDDLEKAMQLTDTQDIAAESKMLKSIIRFGGEMCKEVMTPRVDMVDIEFKTPFPKVLECIVENNYSRIPVYQGTEDHIKGVLYIKDLLPHLTKPANFRWQSLIRSAFFVPETKMIDDLLRDFQENKVHIAIVVDEFGGTSGLVTMEDIIEEIVGEIHDETDDEDDGWHRLNKNTWLFEGRTLLIDFYKVMQLDEDFFEEVEGDADTLAGLILEIKGDFPELHERLTYKQFTFEVMEMDQRRIVSVKVIRGKK
jgi:gliding motility-associated protein GldE